jgi:hypothetical protein
VAVDLLRGGEEAECTNEEREEEFFHGWDVVKCTPRWLHRKKRASRTR